MNVAALLMDHGTRQGYRQGCGCLACRAANADYTASCRSNESPVDLVDAGPVKAHLEQLARLGVGYRRAARLAGVSERFVLDVRKGRAMRLRSETAAALLGVEAKLAHGQRVPGWRTWRFIDSLEREGFTRAGIAERLGLQSPQLQLHHRRVTVKTALRVKALWNRVMECATDERGAVIEAGVNEQGRTVIRVRVNDRREPGE